MQDPSKDEQRDDADFASLMALHGAAVRSYVSSLLPNQEDRDEVLQETHLVLWSKRQQYDRARPFLKWACGIAYRQVQRRRSQLSKSRIIFSDEAIHLLAIDLSESLEKYDARGKALEGCLKSLPSRDQKVVSARYREEMSVSKIAADRGLSESAMYKSLKRIRESLRDCVRRTLSSDHHQSKAIGLE